MFSEIFIWIQIVAFMYMYHVLYNEILKKQMEEYKEKIKAAALKEMEEIKTMMQRKEKEEGLCAGLNLKDKRYVLINSICHMCYYSHGCLCLYFSFHI